MPSAISIEKRVNNETLPRTCPLNLNHLGNPDFKEEDHGM